MDTRLFPKAMLCLLFLFTSSVAQSQMDDLLNTIQTYSDEKAPDKVYIQTDKPYYTSGEDIWIKTVLVNGISHLQSEKSKIVYLELLDPSDEVVVKKKLFIQQYSASADIKIPIQWESGNYILRAYTNYMRNADEDYFYQKEIPILQQSPQSEISQDLIELKNEDSQAQLSVRPNVRFFPEGGELIAGLQNRIGVKATDADGNNLALEGKIEDESGLVVTTFRCQEFGIGAFSFKPEKDKTYKAVVYVNGVDQVLDFPKAKSSGYILNINNRKDRILINVSTNESAGLKGFFVIGHLRGKPFFNFEIKEDLDEFSAKLYTKQAKEGVAHFTLFNPKAEPICERLIFLHNPKNKINLNIQNEKERYASREKVNIELAALDSNSQMISADLSMLVLDAEALGSTGPYSSLSSWLLLNSDLKGKIENPNYFFEGEMDNKKRHLLDALMLTHGWRRFVWKDIRKLNRRAKFKAEKGLFVKGKTTALNNENKEREASVFLNFFNNGIYEEDKSTKSNGSFSFGPYIIYDSTEVILQARVPSKKSKADQLLKGNRQLSIWIDEDAKSPSLNRSIVKTYKAEADAVDRFLKNSREVKRVNSSFDGLSYELDEFVVTSKKRNRKKSPKQLMNEMSGAYSSPSKRMIVDSLPGTDGLTVFDLLQRIPGVTVRGAYPNQTASIRGPSSITGSNEPLYLYNGSPTDVGFISSMLASEVLFVDVFKGPDAAIFGSRGANGVIAVYPRTGTSNENAQREPGIINYTMEGFYKAREFYAPNYSKKKEEHEKPDYRTTIYWSPQIILDGKKSQEESFFTADNPGDYLIIVEGISADGRCIYQSKKITVY